MQISFNRNANSECAKSKFVIKIFWRLRSIESREFAVIVKRFLIAIERNKRIQNSSYKISLGSCVLKWC
jgi:hypothetical protein